MIAVIEQRGLYIDTQVERFHIVLYMSLVDYQCLHAILRLLFVFYHAERKLVEGSQDEECASTAPKSAQPPNVQCVSHRRYNHY